VLFRSQGETDKPLKAYDLKHEDGSILVNIEEELVYEFDTEDADDDFFK